MKRKRKKKRERVSPLSTLPLLSLLILTKNNHVLLHHFFKTSSSKNNLIVLDSSTASVKKNIVLEDILHGTVHILQGTVQISQSLPFYLFPPNQYPSTPQGVTTKGREGLSLLSSTSQQQAFQLVLFSSRIFCQSSVGPVQIISKLPGTGTLTILARVHHVHRLSAHLIFFSRIFQSLLDLLY